jgi:hypothetical protein
MHSRFAGQSRCTGLEVVDAGFPWQQRNQQGNLQGRRAWSSENAGKPAAGQAYFRNSLQE